MKCYIELNYPPACICFSCVSVHNSAEEIITKNTLRTMHFYLVLVCKYCIWCNLMEFEMSGYGRDELSCHSGGFAWSGRYLGMQMYYWGFLCQSKWAASDTILMKQHWKWMQNIHTPLQQQACIWFTLKIWLTVLILTVRTLERIQIFWQMEENVQNIKCDGSTMAHVFRCCSDGLC